MKFKYELLIYVLLFIGFFVAIIIFSNISESQTIERCQSKGWESARFVNNEWECYNISQGVKDASGDKNE